MYTRMYEEVYSVTAHVLTLRIYTILYYSVSLSSRLYLAKPNRIAHVTREQKKKTYKKRINAKNKAENEKEKKPIAVVHIHETID